MDPKALCSRVRQRKRKVVDRVQCCLPMRHAQDYAGGGQAEGDVAEGAVIEVTVVWV